MIDLAPALLPILLVDVVNPVLFAMLVFAAGTSRPVANSTALLAGHTLAYFVAGILVSFGIAQISARLANPHRVDFVLSAIVGLGLIAMALTTRKSGAPSRDEPAWELTPARLFAFGAVLNFVGIPFALPYFAVIDQIVKADLDVAESLTVLAIYNGFYALPFMVVPISAAAAGESGREVLERINGYIARSSDLLMPWMLLALGLVICADSAAYFIRGEGLLDFSQ